MDLEKLKKERDIYAAELAKLDALKRQYQLEGAVVALNKLIVEAETPAPPTPEKQETPSEPSPS